MLNPDTLVTSGAVQALVDFLDTQPEAGAAGARIVRPDGSMQISSHPRPTLSRELWRLFHLDALSPYAMYSLTKWEANQPQVIDVLAGACLLLRKEVLEQVGFLDEDYFMYTEEVDLCYRIQRAGWLASLLDSQRGGGIFWRSKYQAGAHRNVSKSAP